MSVPGEPAGPSLPSLPSGPASGRRVLYLDGYTVPAGRERQAGGAPSSDAIGYGVTASAAIRTGLAAAGFDLARPEVAVPAAGDGAAGDGAGAGDERVGRLRWLLSSYDGVLDVLSTSPSDVVFSFHAFSTFPTEIRRMLLDLGLDVPLVGYTHGSHWDPSDTFRFQAYPGMELLDLANLHVLDRVLLVSDYLRATLWETISAFNAPLAKSLDAKAKLSACRWTSNASTPTEPRSAGAARPSCSTMHRWPARTRTCSPG